MKKVYFKKWVDVVLVVIQMMLIMLLGSEVDNTFIFVISKLIFLTLFILNSYILIIKNFVKILILKVVIIQV